MVYHNVPLQIKLSHIYSQQTIVQNNRDKNNTTGLLRGKEGPSGGEGSGVAIIAAGGTDLYCHIEPPPTSGKLCFIINFIRGHKGRGGRIFTGRGGAPLLLPFEPPLKGPKKTLILSPKKKTNRQKRKQQYYAAMDTSSLLVGVDKRTLYTCIVCCGVCPLQLHSIEFITIWNYYDKV